MTRDDIIRMAREAGFARYMTDGEINWSMFETFTQLVEAAEREACAKVCDERQKDFVDLFHKYGYEEDSGAGLASMQCAKAIRARGQQ